MIVKLVQVVYLVMLLIVKKIVMVSVLAQQHLMIVIYVQVVVQV